MKIKNIAFGKMAAVLLCFAAVTFGAGDIYGAKN